MQANTVTLLTTIKGKAMNKERARVWIESTKLADFGFARGERIDIVFNSDSITVRTNTTGKRKVAGRERNGQTICILDICFDQHQRGAMFHGSERLAVFAEQGMLTIRAEA